MSHQIVSDSLRVLLANLKLNAFNRMMSRRILISIFFCIIIIYAYSFISINPSATKPLNKIRSITAQRVERTPPIPVHIANSTIEKSKSFTPSTPFKGKIREIFIQEGQMVEKGDPLFMMNHKNISGSALELEKQLKKGKEKYRELEIKLHRTEEPILKMM